MHRKLIATSYSPNTREKDLILNEEILRNRLEWFDGKDIDLVKDWFTHYYPESKVYTFNYARSALFTLLTSIEHTSEDEVIYQGFTCAAASLPAIWAGYKVKYIDISPENMSYDLSALKKNITTRTKAIVIQYTLGCTPNIEKIREIINGRDIILIEDCTHYLPYPSEDLSNRHGNHFDHSVFSFGRDKVISSVDGGVLVSRKDTEKIDTLYKKLKYPSEKWLSNRLHFSSIWQSIKDHYFTYGKFIHLIQSKRGLISTATSPEEKLGNRPIDIPALLPNALAKLAMAQLEDIDQIQSHRYKISEIYKESLEGNRSFELFSEINIPPLRFPILHNKRDEIRLKMNGSGVITGDWYDRPVAPSSFPDHVTSYQNGSCPNAEEISSRIFNLPTHINISEDDARYIAQMLIDISSHLEKND